MLKTSKTFFLPFNFKKGKASLSPCPRYYQNGKSSSADVAGGTYAGELCTGVTGAC